MNVTIHQPTYLPYLGFFYKASEADVFVVYDTAQFEKGSVHNRQQIRTANGSVWLTIPLKSSLTPFHETMISYDMKRPWFESHWRSIELNYKKTPYFHTYRDELFRLYHEGHPATLGEFNLRLIRFLLNAFHIQTKLVLFSELSVPGDLSPSEKLAAACEALKGKHYISGPSGKKYLDLDPFAKRNISVSYFEFEHPEYPQYHAKYDQTMLKNMSAIDALFNIGKLPVVASSTPTTKQPLFVSPLQQQGHLHVASRGRGAEK